MRHGGDTQAHTTQPQPHNNVSITVVFCAFFISFFIGVVIGCHLECVIHTLVRFYALCRPINRGNGNADPEAIGENETERERERDARKERLTKGNRKLSVMLFVIYKRGHDMILSRECIICLEDFEDHDVCRVVTGCNHAFHALCVDDWLKKQQNCPVCRGSI